MLYFDYLEIKIVFLVKKWRTRRKMIAPVFNINLLKRSALDLIEFSEDLVQEIGNSSGKSVDVVPLTAKYIFLSICGISLLVKLSNQYNPLFQSSRLY